MSASKLSSVLLADVVVTAGCFTLLMATSHAVPLVWDEPNAILRAEKLETWLGLWFRPNNAIGRPWEPNVIHDLCPYTVQIEGHPAFYGFVIAVGHALSAPLLSDLASYRCGPMLLYSIAAAAMFHRLVAIYGRVTALVGVAFLLTLPRLFAHAHFASIDGPLTACWLLTWAVFDWARRSSIWGPLLWGVLLGTTLSCKFTGWLAIVGFAVWAVVYRDRPGLRVCMIGVCVALPTFVDLNPALWNDPLNGMREFFTLNLGRAENGLNIPTVFLGERFDLEHSLPWYNTLAWIGLTVPPLTLLMSIFGLAQTLRHRRQDRSGMLIMFNWVLLVVVRALPGAPPHDAERLWLPSFPFLAALAAIGTHSLLLWARAKPSTWRARYCHAAMGLAVAGASAETVWYAPQWLSYYTPVVGGLRGATRLGLEPAYYWDGLDREVLAWLRRNSASDDLVYCRVSVDFEKLMSRDGNLPFKFSLMAPERCRWYIVQNRPSFLDDVDRKLLAEERPLFVKTIRDENSGFGPWRLDVPLVLVFSREQFTRAQRATSPQMK